MILHCKGGKQTAKRSNQASQYCCHAGGLAAAEGDGDGGDQEGGGQGEGAKKTLIINGVNVSIYCPTWRSEETLDY